MAYYAKNMMTELKRSKAKTTILLRLYADGITAIMGFRSQVKAYSVVGLKNWLKKHKGIDATGYSFGKEGFIAIDSTIATDLNKNNYLLMLIAHELGHFLLDLPHNDKEGHFMNPVIIPPETTDADPSIVPYLADQIKALPKWLIFKRKIANFFTNLWVFRTI